MTRKQRRATMILSGLAVLGVAAGLVLYAVSDAVTFFYSPSDVAERGIGPGQRFRLGGLVAEGSVVRGPGTTIRFSVTDGARSLPVRYTGLLPDLFREGQGVVTEGRLDADGGFLAESVLARHDEAYMPPEVADALKKQGKGEAAQGAEP